MPIYVHVRVPAGNLCKAAISKETTSNDLLNRFKAEFRINTDGLVLANGSNVLDTKKTLYEQNVHDENLLFLVPAGSPPKLDIKPYLNYRISIFVRMPDEKIIMIHAVPNDTIQDIYDRALLKERGVVLLNNGVRAVPQMKLAEYGIKEGSILISASYWVFICIINAKQLFCCVAWNLQYIYIFCLLVILYFFIFLFLYVAVVRTAAINERLLFVTGSTWLNTNRIIKYANYTFVSNWLKSKKGVYNAYYRLSHINETISKQQEKTMAAYRKGYERKGLNNNQTRLATKTEI